MPRTFFAELTRTDGAPVIVEYLFSAGEASTYSPINGADGGDPAEVTIVSAWLKADENDLNAPNVEPTDTERESWVEMILETHVDEPDEDD